MSKPISRTKHQWGWLIQYEDYFVLSKRKKPYVETDKRDTLIILSFLLPVVVGFYNLGSLFPLSFTGGTRELNEFLSAMLGFCIFLMLGMLYAAKGMTEKIITINGDFNSSLAKKALDNENTLDALFAWSAPNRENNYVTISDYENFYRNALKYGNSEEVATFLAAFSGKLPSPGSQEAKGFKEVLFNAKYDSENKIKKTETEKFTKKVESRKKNASVIKEIEAAKPGLQTFKGVYSWNPEEVVNMGELR